MQPSGTIDGNKSDPLRLLTGDLMKVSVVDVQVSNPRLGSDNELIYDQVRLCVQVTRRHFPAFWKTSTLTRWYRRAARASTYNDEVTGMFLNDASRHALLKDADTEALHEIHGAMVSCFPPGYPEPRGC
jgi:hypothetical protein